jgi:uncharacterized membrane protein YdbT with pleckstrin-like domain
MLCQYKNIFGDVNTGIHSYRIFNVAIADVILTMILALIIHLFIPGHNYFIILALLFILGIVAHRVFCVKTTVDRLLFE